MKNASYHSIRIEILLSDPNHQDWPTVQKLVAEGIKSKAVKPLKFKLYANDNLKEVFWKASNIQERVAVVEVFCYKGSAIKGSSGFCGMQIWQNIFIILSLKKVLQFCDSPHPHPQEQNAPLN